MTYTNLLQSTVVAPKALSIVSKSLTFEELIAKGFTFESESGKRMGKLFENKKDPCMPFNTSIT